MQLLRRLTIYDLYERHTVAARLLLQALGTDGTALRVLDVGGRCGLLEQYAPRIHSTVTINPDATADVVGGVDDLPFADGCFPAVVSLDTLEHVPRGDRLHFIHECLRVSSDVAVIAAPYGSTEHISREKQLNDAFYAAHGHYHEYLAEHVELGLPTPQDIDAYRQALGLAGIELWYAGDFVWQADAFERSIDAAAILRPFALPVNALHRLQASALLHPIDLRSTPDDRVNRFYMVIKKQLTNEQPLPLQ